MIQICFSVFSYLFYNPFGGTGKYIQISLDILPISSYNITL